jgi:hypothetical protein
MWQVFARILLAGHRVQDPISAISKELPMVLGTEEAFRQI